MSRNKEIISSPCQMTKTKIIMTSEKFAIFLFDKINDGDEIL